MPCPSVSSDEELFAVYKDVANHPEDRLVEMKRKHEERIARITAIAPEKESEIILYGANIGKHASPLSYAGMSDFNAELLSGQQYGN